MFKIVGLVSRTPGFSIQKHIRSASLVRRVESESLLDGRRRVNDLEDRVLSEACRIHDHIHIRSLLKRHDTRDARLS
jgi:hypothetical protein